MPFPYSAINAMRSSRQILVSIPREIWSFRWIPLFFVGCALLGCDLKSQKQLDSVTVGMTKEQVLKIVGEPKRKSAGNVWHYQVWGANDLYCICFDKEDRVFDVSF